MNIVLIGMRGSGKTAVGRLIAGRLGREFVDMDELIVARAGMSITDIVQKYGWEHFRRLEAAVAGDVSGRRNIVNAAGGGVVTRAETVQRLKKNAIMVWLRAGADSLLGRIGEDSGRPLLEVGRSWPEDIRLTLAERQPLYRAAADYTVDTENRPPEVVAEAIIKLIGNRGDLND